MSLLAAKSARGRANDRPPMFALDPAVSPSIARPQQLGSGCKRPRRLGDMGSDCIHQGRRKAVVGFQMQLLQSRPDGAHLPGRSAGLDDRGDECCELGRRPPKIVDWYMEGKIEIDPMITHTMPLPDINKGFELMHEGKSIRSVVVY
jgi:hypothetical protein